MCRHLNTIASPSAKPSPGKLPPGQLPSGKLAAWGLLPAAALGLVASACSGGQAYIHDEVVEATYEVPPGTHTVHVELLDGGVTFHVGEPGRVEIEAKVRIAAASQKNFDAMRAVDPRPAPKPSGEPGVLLLRVPDLPAGCSRPADQIVTRTLVRVPPGLAVVGVTHARGHMAAVERRGSVRLETPHGDLRVYGCEGDVVLRSGRGAVLVDRHRGSLDVELGRWQGKQVEVYEELGATMQIFVHELGRKGLRLVTPNSGVQCHVPADASFVMDVATLAGRAKNSFGVPLQPTPGHKFGNAMRGVVGEGGPTLHIAAIRGNVSVRSIPGER